MIKKLKLKIDLMIERGLKYYEERIERLGRALFNQLSRNPGFRYKIDNRRLVRIRKYDRQIPNWIAKRIDELDARERASRQCKKIKSKIQQSKGGAVKVIVNEKYNICDRCGKRNEASGKVTKSGYHIGFSRDVWEYIWDGKSIEYGACPSHKKLHWGRIRDDVKIELCEDCYDKYKQFWTQDIFGKKVGIK